MHRISLLRIAAVTPLLLMLTAAAFAQTAPPPQPLVVERIPTGWVLAPDFKATELDDRFGQLAGAYGGRVTDDTLLIGVAAYWLVNGSDDFKLGYGGLLLGWNADRSGRVRFGTRALVGGGSATLGRSDAFFTHAGGRGPLIRFGGRGQPALAGRALPLPSRATVRISDDFVVVEPQGNLSFHLSERIALTGAAGYRVMAATDALRDVLDGPTLSLGLQFGW
jgi:hypothetical protein